MKYFLDLNKESTNFKTFIQHAHYNAIAKYLVIVSQYKLISSKIYENFLLGKSNTKIDIALLAINIIEKQKILFLKIL